MEHFELDENGAEPLMPATTASCSNPSAPSFLRWKPQHGPCLSPLRSYDGPLMTVHGPELELHSLSYWLNRLRSGHGIV
jgi:hypothetical protein